MKKYIQFENVSSATFRVENPPERSRLKYLETLACISLEFNREKTAEVQG
ncbi:hypothetical protein [Dyadobacter sp. 3J3]|nr:hypothetical protein [Dyadobacter sp. 3J3]